MLSNRFSNSSLPITIPKQRSNSVPNLLDLENKGKNIVKSTSSSPLMSSSAPADSTAVNLMTNAASSKLPLIPVLKLEKKDEILNEVTATINNEQKVPAGWKLKNVAERIFDHTVSESALYLSFVRTLQEQEKLKGTEQENTNIAIHGKFSDFTFFKYIAEKADLAPHAYATHNVFLVSEPVLPERKVPLSNRHRPKHSKTAGSGQDDSPRQTKDENKGKAIPFNMQNGTVYIIACCGYPDALRGKAFDETLKNYAKLMPKKICIVLGYYDNPLISLKDLPPLAAQYEQDWLKENAQYCKPENLETLGLDSYPEISFAKITDLYNTDAFQRAANATMEIASTHKDSNKKLSNDVKSYLTRQIQNEKKQTQAVVSKPKTTPTAPSTTAMVKEALQKTHTENIPPKTGDAVTVILWDILTKQAFQNYKNPTDTLQFSLQAARELGLLSIGSDNCNPEMLSTLLSLHHTNPSKIQQNQFFEFKPNNFSDASVYVAASESHLPNSPDNRSQTPPSSLHTLYMQAKLNVNSPMNSSKGGLFKSMAKKPSNNNEMVEQVQSQSLTNK